MQLRDDNFVDELKVDRGREALLGTKENAVSAFFQSVFQLSTSGQSGGRAGHDKQFPIRESSADFIKAGFPMEKIVIRINPIIPTEKGLSVAYRTMISFMEMGFQRYRVSVIDMYPHARSRFKKAGLPLPYGDSGFAPSQAQLSKVDDMLRQAKQFWEGLDNGKVLRIESCAEPGLTEPIACGCISDYDLNLLGFSEDAESSGAGYQRKGCMCYAGKTELLKHKTRCPHGCLYCYWKDMKG